MATGGFYEVPEINPRTATKAEYEACIRARCSTKKATWVGEQWEDLAGRRPEDLPACFLAVKAEALSPTTGWKTKYGEWVPKEMFAQLGRIVREMHNLISSVNSSRGQTPKFSVMTSRLVFQPNDGSKSDLEMIVYNQISFKTYKHHLEEDISLCHVFRKGAQQPHCQPKFRYAAHPLNEFPEVHVSDFDFTNFDYSSLDFTGFDAEGDGMGGRDLPSIDSFCGSKKRARLTPAGRSNVWDNFTKIYTKDPKVVYAACNHCGRMFRVIGGSTSSLLKHSNTCQCKPDSSISSVTTGE